MKTQTDLHGQATALERSLSRAASFAELGAERQIAGRWVCRLLRIGEQGNAMIEFALLLPVLLLLTTGLLVFGIAMNNYLQLTNAVSVGARTVAISSGAASASDPCALASTAIAKAAPGLNSSLLTYSFTFNTSSTTGPSCTSFATDLASGTSVTVTATYPLSLSVFGAILSQSDSVLSATSTELVQ